jgi:CBS domain-containing protein
MTIHATAAHAIRPEPAMYDLASEPEVRDVMRPGVVAVPEDASLRQVRRAMRSHAVHAVVVVGSAHGHPLGWITARGLLAWLDRDEGMVDARDAITEAPASIQPSASVREAVAAMLQREVTHLLVRKSSEGMPEGTLSELDLLAYGRW